MTVRWACAVLFLAILMLGPGAPTVFADPPPPEDQPADTAHIDEQPALPDSVKEHIRQEVANIQEWLLHTEADSADTVQPSRAPVHPPMIGPLHGSGADACAFNELTARPHTALTDHLLWIPEIDAPAKTDYGTERQFLYRGLNPLAVSVAPDGIVLDLQRPTFPQTMSPDLMPVSPYMFSSMYHYPVSGAGAAGEVIATRTSDSLHAEPFSDFFVRRGDYGLSLTQGRLFRSLPGGRTVNLGFSFAQSDGRGLYDAGRNRNLFAKIITPVQGPYNVSAAWYQYSGKSDIQTTSNLWRYRFERDDLSWRFDAILFRGDTTRSPVFARFVYDNNKYVIRTQGPDEYLELYGEHALFEKTSQASLAVIYAPQDPDSAGNRRAGISLSLDQFHDRSEHFRRPEYTIWGEKSWQPSRQQTLYLSAMINGNDDDPPAPTLAANWQYAPNDRINLALKIQRLRIIPNQMDRDWLARTATFVDREDRPITYSEAGDADLDSWWSNSVKAEIGVQPGRRFSLTLSGWASYEQDYYYWHDLDEDSLAMVYRPTALDARTAGITLGARLADLGPISTRVQYGFKRAEEINGRRLPDYFDHRATGAVDADLTVSKFNLELHASTEMHYWRAPSTEYTFYDRRDVFRTDVLGSATIKNFTIYWLAQNVFNYGYRKAPDFNYLGSTIMWGLHLRFYN